MKRPPPLSSQPSRPRPTPRASRPPRTRARLLPHPRPRFDPSDASPDPNAASPKTARIWSKAEPRIWSRALHSGGQRFRARAAPSPAARVGTSPVLVGDSDHLFVHGVSVRPREDEARALHPQRRHRRVLRSFRDGVRHARRVQIFLLNLTNADAVVPGPPSPALREIGPFVMHKGKEKKSNVTFHGARDDRVSYVATSYAEWTNPPSARDARWTTSSSRSTPRITPWSTPSGPRRTSCTRSRRAWCLLSWTPSPRCFLALAADPTTAAAMPHVAAAAADDTGASLRALALAQWGDCSPSAARASPRSPPRTPREVSRRARVWRVRLDGRGRRDGRLRRRGLRRRVGVDVRRARDVFKRRPRTSSTLRRRPRDVVGRVRDARAFRERVRGARRTLRFACIRECAAAGADAMGPFLGPSSSGLFVARTVREWILGYVDPSRRRANDLSIRGI